MDEKRIKHFLTLADQLNFSKAADLLNTLNKQYGLQLPVEKADIERLDLYRVDEMGNKWPMLDTLFEQG